MLNYFVNFRFMFLVFSIGNPTPMEARSIRKLIAEAACSVYGIESTLYLTTAIIDLYEDAKVEVESASIVVIFIF